MHSLKNINLLKLKTKQKTKIETLKSLDDCQLL